MNFFQVRTFRKLKLGYSFLMRIQLLRQSLDGGRKIFVLLQNQGETKVLQRQEEGGAWIALMVGTGREVRLKQNLKYTKCPVSIILNVKHWEYYEPFITIPFTETAGVGVKSKNVQI